MVQQGAAGLLLDPGLGKTSITLAAFMVLKKQKLVDRVLVIAPLRPCYSVWPVEAKKWSEFVDLRVHVLHGKGKTAAALKSDADVFVINPEGLEWLSEKRWQWPQMLVVDESTKFKHTSTKRFKTLRKLLGKFRRRYILTGSPAPNGLLDLFGQIYILDQGNALGRFITHYRQQYFWPTGFGGYKWVMKTNAEKEIYRAIDPLVLRLDAADYLKMPPKIVTTVHVELPERGRKLYDELEKKMILQLKEGDVTAFNAGVLTNKCRQVANGTVYTDLLAEDYRYGRNVRDRGYAVVHRAKIEATLDLVDELAGQSAIIAYDFNHEREQLEGALKSHLHLEEVPVLGGGVSPKRGREIETEWNRGQLRVLLAHPASAAHGLNLQAGGPVLIWFSLPWNLEHYDQLIHRLWRQGQTERVFVYHLVTKNTVDETVLMTLIKKNHTQRSLLDALRTRYLEEDRS